MSAWRVAKSLLQLREQVNAVAPKRNKVYDGTIGDTAHADGKSDHNPNAAGVVTALDITHDPNKGCDCADITEALRQSEDRRIKYVIYAGRMFSSYAGSRFKAWAWRPYSGENKHNKHMHVSVQGDAPLYDDASGWAIAAASSSPAYRTTADLNVRVGPGIKYGRILTLPKGTRVQDTHLDLFPPVGPWRNIWVPAGTIVPAIKGWVHSAYLESLHSQPLGDGPAETADCRLTPSAEPDRASPIRHPRTGRSRCPDRRTRES
jgi:hypothetical protein